MTEGISRESYGTDCARADAEWMPGMDVCGQGCLGLGNCVAACRLDALHIGPMGAAIVDWEKCVGCGLCVKACPRHLIRLTEPEYNIQVACLNEDAAERTKVECKAGCIACGVCEKVCPSEAVHVRDNHAVIDEEKCIACGMCAVKCPRGVIRDQNGILTAR